MAAGLHKARLGRGPGSANRLSNRQCILVGAKADRVVAWPAALDRANQGNAADPFHHLNPEVAQVAGDPSGGSLLRHAEFRVGTNVAAVATRSSVKPATPSTTARVMRRNLFAADVGVGTMPAVSLRR